MRTIKRLQRPCSVLAAAPQSLPIQEFVATAERMSISVTSAGIHGLGAEMYFKTHGITLRMGLQLCVLHFPDPLTMTRRTRSCAMPVVSVNMHALTSCCMQNPAVPWIL